MSVSTYVSFSSCGISSIRSFTRELTRALTGTAATPITATTSAAAARFFIILLFFLFCMIFPLPPCSVCLPSGCCVLLVTFSMTALRISSFILIPFTESLSSSTPTTSAPFCPAGCLPSSVCPASYLSHMSGVPPANLLQNTASHRAHFLVTQGKSQTFPPPLHPFLYRILGNPQHLRDFKRLVSFDIMQIDHRLQLLRQIHQFCQHLTLFRKFTVLFHILQLHGWMPHPASVRIPASVGRNLDQPRLLMLPVPEPGSMLHVSAESILYRILCILFVTQHDNADPVKHIPVFSNNLFYRQPSVTSCCSYVLHIPVTVLHIEHASDSRMVPCHYTNFYISCYFSLYQLQKNLACFSCLCYNMT